MRLIFAAVGLAAALAASAPARAQDAEREVRAASAALSEAIRGRDAAALDRLLAPDFTLAFGDGADPLPAGPWRANLMAMRIDRYEERIADLRVHGAIAVATVEGAWDVVLNGRRLAERFLVRDFWVRRDGRWQLFRRHRPQ